MKATVYKILAAVSGLFVLAVAVMIPSHPASAAVTSAKLENLYVLNSLFGNNDSTGILNTSSNNGSADLGNLILLDQLFGVNTFGTSKNTSILSTGHGSLGELILMNQLFNNNNTLGLGSGGGSSGSGSSTTGGTASNNNLGRLFVLDRLFAN